MVLTAGDIEIVKDMFFKGYTHKDIHYILETQFGIRMRFSYFSKKVMPKLGLFRRGPRALSPLNEIIQALQFELNGPSRCSGMEEMRQILKTKYRLLVPRLRNIPHVPSHVESDDGSCSKFNYWTAIHVSVYIVRELLRIYSPDDVARRRRRRLLRRQYRSCGPNYVWHMDGYDKLAQYGIGIHGAIDGFSRYLIWLKAGCSNRNPKYIAGYFLEAVHFHGGCPTVLRMDCGTETVKAATIQCILREPHHDSLSNNSIWYGCSHANQRIESWWAQLRRKRSGWWRTHFRDMEANGEIQLGNKVHRMCLQYSYLRLIQMELDEVSSRWNSHLIRQQRHGDVVSGRPEMMYNHPETLGNHCRDYLREVDLDSDEVAVCAEELCDFTDGQDLDFRKVADELCLLDGRVNQPGNAEEALGLYRFLRTKFDQLL